MKIILKILAAPLVILLTVIVWLCALLLNLSAFIFGITGTLVGILGVAVLITTSVQNGIILLVIALLVSPIGLPMAAVGLLGGLQRLWYTIQDKIYG